MTSPTRLSRWWGLRCVSKFGNMFLAIGTHFWDRLFTDRSSFERAFSQQRRRQKNEVITWPTVSLLLKFVYLSQDISELRWPLQIHTLVAGQPAEVRYGEGGEAIVHKASCSPLATSIFPSPRTVTELQEHIICCLIYLYILRNSNLHFINDVLTFPTKFDLEHDLTPAK
jgi:hypothetical protein